ncbi:N-acetyltransferase, partial [Humibacter sp.]|uniref:GNAT family N-acetyltransferase n=1 Tax=Humibacter sp. TaxID=1940291 RepID=UPI002B8E6A77
MVIRDARPDDVRAIAQVHAQAFGASHGRVVAALVEALHRRAAEDTVSLVTVADDDQVIGHVTLTPALLDAPQRLVTISVLSPLAVLPERQGQGVGRALVEDGVARLVQCGVPLVVLEGDPAYYRKLG